MILAHFTGGFATGDGCEPAPRLGVAAASRVTVAVLATTCGDAAIGFVRRQIKRRPRTTAAADLAREGGRHDYDLVVMRLREFEDIRNAVSLLRL